MAKTKYKSGFCGTGSCEGTKPKGALGTPMKTCFLSSDDCACECHVRIDRMFEQMGMERVFIENPEYRTPHSPYVMPTPEEIAEEKLQAARAAMPQPVIDMSPRLPDVDGMQVVAAVPIHTNVTPSGRKQKGALEREVFDAIQALGVDTEPTPVKIAEWINERRPPSTGAIGAVFNRWSDKGFAEIGKKPIRFVSFKGDGTWEEWLTIKARGMALKTTESRQSRRSMRHGIRA